MKDRSERTTRERSYQTKLNKLNTLLSQASTGLATGEQNQSSSKIIIRTTTTTTIIMMMMVTLAIKLLKWLLSAIFKCGTLY